MLISEWNDGFEIGVYTATNCSSPGRPPQIVGGRAIVGFIAFGTDGAIMNMGEAFDTFEDAAKFLESVFVWRVSVGAGV